jgi:dTDP-4-amino-4,6-dideoxygalactose transaminase
VIGVAPPRLFLSPPHLAGSERSLVAEAFDSNYVAPVGPMLEAFERDFCAYTGIPHAVALASGTAAIHLALRCLGIGAGDRVWASTLTFVGSVGPVMHQGATPVFFDADPDSWTLDPVLLQASLEEAARAGALPKAVLPTDLYGQCCDLDAIRAACDPYGIPVVADAAEAMGARYRGRHAGAGARAAAFSFNGNKIMTTSGGGMLASEDRGLVDEACRLSQQARDPAPHYEHSTIGYNYRMSNILAAIGRAQLAVLDERVRRRRAIFDAYRERLAGLPGVSFMPEAGYGRTTRWLTVVQFDPTDFPATAEEVRLALEAENIEARPVWKPMHLQPVFREAPAVGGAVAERLFRHGLCLPSGSQMTDTDIDRVAETIRKVAGLSRTGPR